MPTASVLINYNNFFVQANLAGLTYLTQRIKNENIDYRIIFMLAAIVQHPEDKIEALHQ